MDARACVSVETTHTQRIWCRLACGNKVGCRHHCAAITSTSHRTFHRCHSVTALFSSFFLDGEAFNLLERPSGVRMRRTEIGMLRRVEHHTQNTPKKNKMLFNIERAGGVCVVVVRHARAMPEPYRAVPCCVLCFGWDFQYTRFVCLVCDMKSERIHCCFTCPSIPPCIIAIKFIYSHCTRSARAYARSNVSVYILDGPFTK